MVRVFGELLVVVVKGEMLGLKWCVSLVLIVRVVWWVERVD